MTGGLWTQWFGTLYLSDLVVLAIPLDEARNAVFHHGRGRIAHVLAQGLDVRIGVRHAPAAAAGESYRKKTHTRRLQEATHKPRH